LDSRFQGRGYFKEIMGHLYHEAKQKGAVTLLLNGISGAAPTSLIARRLLPLE